MSVAVKDVHADYGAGPVLHGVSLEVPEQGLVALLGRNGAGKTTLTRIVMGLMKPSAGTVSVLGEAVRDRGPERLARAGLAYMPQESGVFNSLTVAENLALAGPQQRIEQTLQVFPALGERLRQRAGTLSGGERKMLGIARILIADARVCMFDEPTEGLWTAIVDDIVQVLRTLKERRSILLVEQNLTVALEVADYVYVMAQGRIELEGSPQTLRHDARLQELMAV